MLHKADLFSLLDWVKSFFIQPTFLFLMMNLKDIENSGLNVLDVTSFTYLGLTHE